MSNEEVIASGSVIVPLVRYDDQMSREAALTMLAQGDGLLLSYAMFDDDASAQGNWLASSGPLAKGLGNAVRASSPSLGTVGKHLFSLELPAGHALVDLVPAVGGGFRGLTRTAASGSKIAGHARLLPAEGAVAVGVGAALGPMLAVMALSIAGEMLAQHQITSRLDRIAEAVSRLERARKEEQEARLHVASEAIQRSSHALLDGIGIPQAVGVGPALNNLNELVVLSRGRLDGWQSTLDRAKKTAEKDGTVSTLRLVDGLAGQDRGAVDELSRQARNAYLAFALDARASLLSVMEAAVGNPNLELAAFERDAARRLERIESDQTRLRDVFGQMSCLPLSGPGLPASDGTTNKAKDARALFSRLHYGLSADVAALPVLDARQRPLLQLEGRSDGAVRAMEPTA